jgi:pimeloyl-ACP methyl ester carboxylesterase
MPYTPTVRDTSIRRGFADTSLGQLHYRYAGDGPPLVLLHNTWLSSKMYLEVMPELAKEFSVYALDTLGQGDSDPMPAETLEIPAYSKVLLEALDSLGLEKPVVAGHHTGSVIASEASIIAPEKIGKLVISGMPYWRNPNTRLEVQHGPMFADWAANEDGSYLVDLWKQHGGGGRYQLDTSAETFIDYLKPGPRTSSALRALFRWDSANRLPLITVPTLILCAETDGFVKNIQHVADLVPNSKLVILPGGDSHPLLDLEGFKREVTAFAKS